MTVMPVLPREPQWTVDDLDRIPEDGQQYELLDGMLLVTPAPVPLHQRVVLRLTTRLLPVCPPGVELLFAPLDWRPDGRTSFQPDLLAFRHEDAGEKNVTGPLVLAVEVLSPSTRRKDMVLKFSKYQDCGVRNYWVVDPDRPSVVAYRLADGGYVEAGRATGAEELQLTGDFEVSLRPADLVSAPV